MMDDEPFDRDAVTAIIVDEAGRFLMQLRDDIASVRYPGYWGLFGGGIDPDESAEDALVREIEEELRFTPTRFQALSEVFYRPAFRDEALCRKRFFVVPVSAAEIASMDQQEGTAMQLFTLAEILVLDKIIPTDAYGLLTYQQADNGD